MNDIPEVKQVPESGSAAPVCSTIVFRVQDAQGRGPWKPGFSESWVEDRDDHDNLKPWYLEMGNVHLRAIVGMHVGSACRTIEQLRRWFTRSEYQTLRRAGYRAFAMEAGTILGESETQLVFTRVKPLNVGVTPIVLYPSNATVQP